MSVFFHVLLCWYLLSIQILCVAYNGCACDNVLTYSCPLYWVFPNRRKYVSQTVLEREDYDVT